MARVSISLGSTRTELYLLHESSDNQMNRPVWTVSP
jgi:hypothetical protein